MDLTVSQNQKHLVSFLGSALRSEGIELVENMIEVGWAAKLNLFKELAVRGNDVLDAKDFRVLGVTMQRETV